MCYQRRLPLAGRAERNRCTKVGPARRRAGLGHHRHISSGGEAMEALRLAGFERGIGVGGWQGPIAAGNAACVALARLPSVSDGNLPCCPTRATRRLRRQRVASAALRLARRPTTPPAPSSSSSSSAVLLTSRACSSRAQHLSHVFLQPARVKVQAAQRNPLLRRVQTVSSRPRASFRAPQHTHLHPPHPPPLRLKLRCVHSVFRSVTRSQLHNQDVPANFLALAASKRAVLLFALMVCSRRHPHIHSRATSR